MILLKIESFVKLNLNKKTLTAKLNAIWFNH